MLSRDKLDAIEARAKAATAAPWCTGSIPWQVWFNGGHGKICRIESTAEDRDFIAHARQDVPALVAEVRRQWGDGPFTCGHEPQYAGGSCAACHALLLEKVQGLELQNDELRKELIESLKHGCVDVTLCTKHTHDKLREFTEKRVEPCRKCHRAHEYPPYPSCCCDCHKRNCVICKAKPALYSDRCAECYAALVSGEERGR